MEVTVAVLAGGRGSRLGGDKAVVALAGLPLISYPLRTARVAGLPAVVVAKAATRLPPLEVPVLLEPDEPTHPLLGIITALERHPAVIALPCDMPFIPPADLLALAEIDATVATLAPGQPFPALYRRSMLPQLRQALDAHASVRSTQAQARRAPASTAPAQEAMTAVNTLEDLARAEQLINER